MISKAITALAVAFAMCVVTSTASALEVTERVRSSCAGDYVSQCSGSTNAQQVYACMRNVGPRLSRPCLVALIKDGYVTRAEVLRRARLASIDVEYLSDNNRLR